MPRIQTTEDRRLEEARIRKKHWKRWGPYLSERQWERSARTKPGGTAGNIFRMITRVPRVSLGKTASAASATSPDDVFWAGAMEWARHILKERLFGLTGNQGNHGEDVKEYYFYLDSTPTPATCGCSTNIRSPNFPMNLWWKNRRRGRARGIRIARYRSFFRQSATSIFRGVRKG